MTHTQATRGSGIPITCVQLTPCAAWAHHSIDFIVLSVLVVPVTSPHTPQLNPDARVCEFKDIV